MNTSQASGKSTSDKKGRERRVRGVFQPGIQLLNRMRYPYKFALISVVFVLPLALALSLGIQEINHTIAFTKNELAGTQYLQGVHKMVADLQTSRGMTEAGLSGDQAFRDHAATLESALHTDLQLLNDLDQQFGTQLDTTRSLIDFQHHWRQFQEERTGLTRQETFAQHTALIDRLLTLMAHVGDRSNLILDPSLDSYYLMDALVIRLPQWAEAIGHVRGMGTGIIARSIVTDQERSHLGYFRRTVAITQETARRNFTVAFQENSAFRETLDAALQDSLRASDVFLQTMDAILLAEEASFPAAHEYWETATQALHAVLHLTARVLPALEETLYARLSAAEARRGMLAGVTVAALLLVLYMFIAFYLSTIASVARMRNVSDRLLHGELDQADFPTEGHDEMTEAVEAFRVVAGVVKTKWQVAEAETTRARKAEGRVAKSEERLQALMGGLADGLIVINERGIVESFNEAASRIFGYTADEMMGRNVSRLVPHPHSAHHDHYLERYLRTGEARFMGQRREVEGVRKDGTRFPMELHLSEVCWDDRHLFTGIVRDLTDRKMAERRTNVHEAVTHVLAESPGVEEAVSKLLQAIGEGLSWRLGSLWQQEEGSNRLRCMDVWQSQPSAYPKFEAVTRATSFLRGVGLPGRVWAEGESVWVPDVVKENNFPRKPIAEQESLHGALAFPLGLQENQVGVMEFFSDRVLEPDSPMLVMLQSLGSQIGEFIQKKQAEARVAESEGRLQAIMDSAPDGLITINERGLVETFNEAASRIFGYPADEMIGRNVSRLLPTPHSDHHDHYLERYLRTGEARFMNKRREVEGVRKDGTLFPMDIHISEVSWGDRHLFTGIIRDLTDRKAMEDALRKSHELNKELLASIASILISVDAQERITQWNTTAEETFGLLATQVKGKLFQPCGIQWDWSLVNEGIRQCRETQQIIRLDDLRFTHPSGKEGFLGITLTPIRGEGAGKISDFLILGTDVTEMKQLQTQLVLAQKMESIGQLAAGIAHEINTPSQFVSDNLRFLAESFGAIQKVLDVYGRVIQTLPRDTVDPQLLQAMDATLAEADLAYVTEEIPKALQQSLDGAERVTNIVRAMKDFSHPGTAEKTPIDLNKAIESTVTVARNEWKYVADLVLHLDPTLPPVPCLPGEFNQVVLNLVVNAAHAIGTVMEKAKGGNGTITISTRMQEDWVEIRIADTGTGIPESARHKIFDPFFTTKDVGKGTGQGLAMAHDVIVNKHGGRLTFETEMGTGTTFIIQLPRHLEQKTVRHDEIPNLVCG